MLRESMLSILWIGVTATVASCAAATNDDSTPETDPAIEATASAGRDPGPRPGLAGAGGFFPTLNDKEQAFFNLAKDRFKEVDSVSGGITGEAGSGLGPTFNGNSCAMCHAQPDVGGSSPGLKSPQKPIPNPQVALATLDKATNVVPSFITANGPVREARFIATSSDKNAPLDGSVHELYTIQGRTDAQGCTLAQPDFAKQLAYNNVIFRIPTPLFGLGLVENTSDATFQANLAANHSEKSRLGIFGRFNTSGNDGTITKFGWKAQNKSLLIFAGEAYNVEQGVTNELFTNERSGVAGCVLNPMPEDSTNIVNPDDGTTVGSASRMSSDLVNFAAFSRLTAPPATATQSTSAQNGSRLFDSIGCANCHSRDLTTEQSIFTGMSAVTYHPFSDFAIHHMGSGLADGINQGAAGPDEFRTAPLWGVGQRLFFLHDGRTSDLGAAIEAHSDARRNEALDPATAQKKGRSEANAVIRNFNNLNASQQTDILNFLRSL